MARARILVVDDSPTQLSLISAPLVAGGFEVVTASSGEEALRKVASDQPNLVVLDVVMPNQNGFQICRAIKNSPESKHIPVILLTSKNQPADKYWGMRQGADEYLTKPFQPETLVSSVRRLV
jgi:twitching motility two-component system response regulator PilH